MLKKSYSKMNGSFSKLLRLFVILMLCISFHVPIVCGIVGGSVKASADEQKYDDIYSISPINTNVTALVLDKSSVIIEHQGRSEFIKVTGICSDGTQVDLTGDVEWISNDNTVAWAYDGRILAVNKGTTTVTVVYGSLTETIDVSVSNSIDIQKDFAEALDLAKNNIIDSELSAQLTSSERDAIVAKARDMVQMVWSGTDYVRGWRDEYTFVPYSPYTGMPYSQTAYQVDDISFFQKRNDSSSGFYDNYTRDLWRKDHYETVIMPKYGNDCSGFVSFSWSISKHGTSTFIEGIRNGTFTKVGNYDPYSPSYNDLYSSYQYLQPGDAVVKDGHTFLIVSSSPSYQLCYCYEQTPYYAVASYWDWSRLATESYMPFSK